MAKKEEMEKISIKEAFSKFSADKSGLSSDEAEKRLRESGPNEISEQRVNPLVKFLGYFWGPIPWMIEIAAILSAAIQHWEDFWVIFAMLLINAVVGFWQEHKADNAIELLKKKLAPEARVLRDGKWEHMQARNLVTGDIVRLRPGDIVPADIKLMKGEYLSVDQSTLTGESLPVEKKASDVCYSGSIVSEGEMEALVVATGMNTYFGKTAELVESAKTRSHFQKAVIKIGDYLIMLALFLVTVIFIAGIFRHENLLEMLKFSLVLVVASIPVALPAVLTITMAVGATLLSKKKAIVSKLVAIEEMAGVDVLCSDKTGTITKNELTVKEIKVFGNYDKNEVLKLGVLASKEENRDPIDDTIFSRAKNAEGLLDEVKKYEVLDFKPFDPKIKHTEATVKSPEGKKIRVAKGAPQVILSMMKDSGIEADINSTVDEFAKKGYRSLGVARTAGGDTWEYAGILALYDPPREDSAETVETARDLGVNIKMVTGDHEAVASEIAREVGLGDDIKTADAFLDKGEREAGSIIEEADGFARVFPEHKYGIVESLQQGRHIVGMTGDGVNDAPALKKADAGIAVSGSTDAARSAASLVLTSPGLSVIIDAIKESRKIFKRMNSYTIYRMAETMRVLFFMTASILLFKFYPVTAIMIVILALLNDIPIMMIAYDNAKIYEKPVRWNMRRVISLALILGLIGVAASFLIFWIGLRVLHLDRNTIQTLIFLKLAVSGHMTIYLARTGEEPFWVKPYPATALLIAAEATQLVATLFAVYGILMPPIGWKLALMVWGYAMALFVVTDFLKVKSCKILDHAGIRFQRMRG